MTTTIDELLNIVLNLSIASFYIIKMLHQAKLEQYHKEIRKQQLNAIFHSKRIKLIEDRQNISIEEESTFHHIDPDRLAELANSCQTEEGIERVYQLGFEDKLQKYLKPAYLNTKQQYLATFILCNLHLITHPKQPSVEFTKDLVGLLERGSETTVSNCATIVFNIANDHLIWKKRVVRQLNISLILCNLLQKKQCSPSYYSYVLRTIVKILNKQQPHDVFRQLFPRLIAFLANPSCNDHLIVSHAYFCYYQLSLMFPTESVTNILEYNLINRFIKIEPLLMETKFTIITLQILQIAFKKLEEKLITQTVLPYLKRIMLAGYNKGNTNVKLLVHTIFIRILEESVMSSTEFMRHEIGSILLAHFEQEEDGTVLHNFVFLFSIVIINIEPSPITQKLQALLQRVQGLIPNDIYTIGFIKETLYKAKRITSQYF